MNYPMRSFRLYMSHRTYAIYVAPVMFLAVLALTVIAGLITGMVTGLPLPPEAATTFSGMGMLVSVLIGFFISSSALAVNRTFATVLAFGGTRRDFWMGSAMGFGVTALIAAVFATALLGIEELTNGWFIGVPVFGTPLLGNGDYLITFVAVLAYSLAALFTGAAFGTIFRAFGATAVTMAIIGAVLIVAGIVAVLVWQREFTIQAAIDLGHWLPSVLAAAFALVCLLVSYVTNKKATV
ncbi:hypothetical protein FCK90_06485 [Kocuria coralli]|uniref:Uncharacterized protein n=1 Tax=Kocuria coralli TaxID=1461025 RepID=A0A5J5L099_9MICC|nr:hypothetical protein [Kocuria coralli]KAA9394466.1 hypothetical protein FCK90_06485 [Kocuria coralli]